MVHYYIYNIIVINKHVFTDHMKALGKVLYILAEEVLKVNSVKSFFGLTKSEYLRFWVSKNWVIKIFSKGGSIKSI